MHASLEEMLGHRLLLHALLPASQDAEHTGLAERREHLPVASISLSLLLLQGLSNHHRSNLCLHLQQKGVDIQAHRNDSPETRAELEPDISN